MTTSAAPTAARRRQPVRRATPCVPTSRSCTSEIHGQPAGLPGQRRHHARSPVRSSRQWTATTSTTTPTCTAACTRSASAPPTPTKAPATRAARFLNAADAAEIVFTRGTTEGINLVAQAWGAPAAGPGRRDRHLHHGAPLQHRPLAAAVRADRRRPEGDPGRRRRRAGHGRITRPCSARRPGWWP